MITPQGSANLWGVTTCRNQVENPIGSAHPRRMRLPMVAGQCDFPECDARAPVSRQGGTLYCHKHNGYDATGTCRWARKRLLEYFNRDFAAAAGDGLLLTRWFREQAGNLWISRHDVDAVIEATRRESVNVGLGNRETRHRLRRQAHSLAASLFGSKRVEDQIRLVQATQMIVAIGTEGSFSDLDGLWLRLTAGLAVSVSLQTKDPRLIVTSLVALANMETTAGDPGAAQRPMQHAVNFSHAYIRNRDPRDAAIRAVVDYFAARILRERQAIESPTVSVKREEDIRRLAEETECPTTITMSHLAVAEHLADVAARGECASANVFVDRAMKTLELARAGALSPSVSENPFRRTSYMQAEAAVRRLLETRTKSLRFDRERDFAQDYFDWYRTDASYYAASVISDYGRGHELPRRPDYFSGMLVQLLEPPIWGVPIQSGRRAS